MRRLTSGGSFVCAFLILVCSCGPTDEQPSSMSGQRRPVLQYDPSKTHPWLFAHDLKQTDGYKYRTQDPWKSWAAGSKSHADASLGFDFAASGGADWEDRGARAADLAFTYHLNGGTSYRDKAISAVLNMNKGPLPGGGVYHDAGRAIFWWALAYDLIQPSLSAAQDVTAKDNLAKMCDAAFWDTRAHTSDGGSWTESDAVAMSGIGLGGLAIIDWKDPNKLGLKSNLSMWLGSATDYFYTADPYAKVLLNGRAIADMGLSPEGQDIWGGNYIHYSYQAILIFAEAYTYYTGKSMAEDYPRLKGLLTEFIWETTPPGYLNNRMTSGGEYTGPMVTRYWNLLDAASQSHLFAYAKRMEASVAAKLLELSNGNLAWGYDYGPLDFLSYRNPQGVTPKDPSWTTRLVPGSLQQTFRSAWGTDATWLSETTMSSNIKDAINPRFDFHQDQLGIEWWSKGNVWLADGSEDKVQGASAEYGAAPVHHNVLLIENPRSPFGTSSVSGMAARGLSKGSMTEGFNHAPASVAPITAAWMNAVVTSMSTDWAVDDNKGYESVKLDAPVTWERTILFPNAEYFIVMDRASSTQTWAYALLFTPTTHDLQKSTSSVQNISLKLSLNGAAFSWEGLSPKKPTAAGTTSSMTWQSRNVHHADAQANLFTVPASEVSVTRMIQRGYGNENVDALNYMPHVLFKQAPAKNLYRVTSLIANLATEAAPSFASVAVTGTGNALAVTLGSSKDYAYSGTGTSQFGPFATDADLVYARGAPPSTFTLIRGTHLDASGAPLISSSVKLDYLTWRRESWGQVFKAKSTAAAAIHLYGLTKGHTYAVRCDGTAYPKLQLAASGTDATLSTDGGEHLYEILDQSGPPPPDASTLRDLSIAKGDGGKPKADGTTLVGDGSIAKTEAGGPLTEAGGSLTEAGGSLTEAGADPGPRAVEDGCSCAVRDGSAELSGFLCLLLGLAALARRSASRRRRP